MGHQRAQDNLLKKAPSYDNSSPFSDWPISSILREIAHCRADIYETVRRRVSTSEVNLKALKASARSHVLQQPLRRGFALAILVADCTAPAKSFYVSTPHKPVGSSLNLVNGFSSSQVTACFLVNQTQQFSVYGFRRY